MNEKLKKAVDSLIAINNASIEYSDEGKHWADDNGLDTSVYSNISHITYFFRAAQAIGKDDKYISDKFLLRACPSNVSPTSYFISLFSLFEVDEIVATPEVNGFVISSLMASGYKAYSINLELTKAWDSRSDADNYRTGILLKR